MHELKKLAHELFEIRDNHTKEIQQLREDVKTGTPTSSSNGVDMIQMFPGGDMAAAHEQIAVLEVHRVLTFYSPRSDWVYFAKLADSKLEPCLSSEYN